jgi:predicted permease
MVGSPVSPSIFALLGAAPAVGRFFTVAEAKEGANRVAILSDRLWRERYGASRDVLGTALVVDGQSYEIIGVARASLRFPDRRVLFWIPYVIPPVAAQPERTATFSGFGRMRPGVTPEQVEAEGTAAARSMPRPMSADLMFGKGGPVVVHARRLADDMTATIRPALLVVSAAVALVILIACANVANLFLSRGVARQRELAVRAAIGGSRWRLARQLLTESAVLSSAGGVVGLLLAAALVDLIPRLAPVRFPRLDDVRLDAGVMAFAALASIFTALASGLAPALRGARVDLSSTLRGSSVPSGSFSGFRLRGLREGLLVVEAAFAVMLLVAAGLLARSFVRLTNVDAGYDADHVLTAHVQMPRSAPPERTGQLLDGLLARLRATPGVISAGAGNMMPLTGMSAITTFPLPAAAGGGKPATTRSLTYVITPGYAETLRLRLREGRFFTERDVSPGVRAMIVNEEFVRQYLSGPAVGRRFGDLYLNDKGTTTEIVGVVGTVLKDGNDRAPEPEIYFVHGAPTRRIQGFVNIVVRTAGDPAGLVQTVRRMVREIDRAAIVVNVVPLSDLRAASVDQPRFATTVLAAFAALALMLACVGLYSVLSYSVSQRRRELGVRSALGASRAAIVGLVLRQGLAVTTGGLVLGLLGAAALTRLMETLLFGVTPLDIVAFSVAALTLLAVAVVACWVPARRAASTDPVEALRCE